MATRATIKIEGIDFAKIYKHWDGYPEATLEWLEQFNKDFTKKRGSDPEYKFAQLLRSSVFDKDLYDLGDSEYTGWGVFSFDKNWGEDFEYTLHADGSVTYKELQA